MERELSTGVELAISLVGIAVLLSIIMAFVGYGNTIKNGSGEQFVDFKENMSLDYMKSLANGEIDNDMPSATAYNIIRSYESIISEEASGYDSTVRVPSRDGSILRDNLKGRVKLEVHEVSGSSFVVLIHVLNRDGVVSNTTDVGINGVISKYGL